MKITLAVRHQGHVPSFKNAKRVVLNSQTKKPFLATRKDVKEWMNRCIQSFESQLFCDTLTTADATLMGPRLPSLTALLLPLDDSRQWVPELTVRSVDVDAGDEGAEIIIETI